MGNRSIYKTFEVEPIETCLGGDEFVVRTMDSLHQSSETVYLRLQKHLKIINTDLNRGYRLSFCIGVTHFNPRNRTTINDLMAEADEALYKNKRARTAVRLSISFNPFRTLSR